MATHAHSSQSIANKEIEVPEWEHTGTANNDKATTLPGAPATVSIKQKFDSMMSPHRRYLGMRRKIFLAVLIAIMLALLALIIGLAVGLTQGSK